MRNKTLELPEHEPATERLLTWIRKERKGAPGYPLARNARRRDKSAYKDSHGVGSDPLNPIVMEEVESWTSSVY